MARAVIVILLAGCGRLQFDAIDTRDSGTDDGSDATSSSHDEDGDGFPDASDLCPHIPSTMLADSDGDMIGDACDPEPMIGRQTRVLFATLQPDDQPFATAILGTGEWTQQADSIALTGTYGSLSYAVALQAFSVEFGFTIAAVTGSQNAQHQFAAGPSGPAPRYFGELNEAKPISAAQITRFDGTNYMAITSSPLATGMHPGEVTFRYTMRTDSPRRAELLTGWPGELYSIQVETPDYVGGDRITVDINNLDLEVRYVWLVAND